MKCDHHQHLHEEIENSCISNVPIFNQLNIGEMKEILDVSLHQKLKKGQLLFMAGDPSDSLYVVHKGKVKIYYLSDSGKEQIIRILQPGDFTGELSLFSGVVLENYAEALEETEMCLIPKRSINELLLRKPTIAVKILEEITKRLQKTEQVIEQLGLHDVEQRMAKMLLDLAEREGGIIQSVSKKDLASIVGTTQETLSRKLNQFQEKGWINLEGQRKIIIKDHQSLADLHSV